MGYVSPLTEDEKRRRSQLGDGEYIGFDLMIMDSRSGARSPLSDKQSDPPKSIDEAVKLEIETTAKSQNMKASEWLAHNAGAPLTKLIQAVAERYVQAAGAAGVTSAFSMDRTDEKALRGIAVRAMRDCALSDLAGGTEAAYERSKTEPNDWRRNLGDAAAAAPHSPAAQATLERMTADAKAEYELTRSRLSAERMNAWRTPASSRR